MQIGKISVNNNEQSAGFNICYKVLVVVNEVCQVSINDNTHYQDYETGDKIMLEDSNGINKLYVKSTGTAAVRYWGYE